MVSTNTTSWHLLREQLMQIEDTMIPSAPYSKDENHWIEFDIDFFMNKKIDCLIKVKELNHSIIITNISNTNNNHDGLLHLFDIIISFNNINFTNINEQTAQYIINAHQDKTIKIRIRRLQPTNLETIEFNLEKEKKFGCTIDGGIKKVNSTDPGIFIVGIKSKSLIAKNGRLRIGDRLIQISNTYMTINLQFMKLNYALKLIKRMRKESTTITFVVAHQT